MKVSRKMKSNGRKKRDIAPHEISSMEKGKSFEKKVSEIFTLMGFKVDRNRTWKTAGNEIDIFLEKKKSIGRKNEYYICECKRWNTPVGIVISMAVDYKKNQGNAWIPFLIDQSYEESKTFNEVFQKNLDDGQVKPPNKKLFLKLLSEGKILLIIDAFDQIDNTINLQTAFYFINKLNKSLEGDAKVIITARTYSFRNSSEIDRIFVNQQTGTHFNEFFRHFKGGKRNSDFEIVYLKKFSGHPCGLPLKYSPGACVGEITENYFRADLDVYSGNSGSPVFCAETHELIGIVSRAQIPDFRWTGNSWITLRYPKTGAHYNGSQCSRASGFAKYISK